MIFPIKNKKDHSGNAITLQYKVSGIMKNPLNNESTTKGVRHN